MNASEGSRKSVPRTLPGCPEARYHKARNLSALPPSWSCPPPVHPDKASPTATARAVILLGRVSTSSYVTYPLTQLTPPQDVAATMLATLSCVATRLRGAVPGVSRKRIAPRSTPRSLLHARDNGPP